MTRFRSRWLRKVHRRIAILTALAIPVACVIQLVGSEERREVWERLDSIPSVLMLATALAGAYLFLLPHNIKAQRRMPGGANQPTAPGGAGGRNPGARWGDPRLAALALVGLVLAGCQSAPACPPSTASPEFLESPPPTALPTYAPGEEPAPIMLEIGRQSIAVDQIVRGPLCNGAWSGTVYVTCDVQVLPWTEQPDFLKGCRLTIEPGTVVYVADHHDAAYYNGCSCHTGEAVAP